MTRVVVPVLLACLAASPGSAQPASSINTVDFPDPQLAGQPSGVTIMNSSCVFGDTFHYQLTAKGELFLRGQNVCGGVAGLGGKHLCRLGPDLHCTGQPSAGAGVDYAVGDAGVSAGPGQARAWSDPREAAALLGAMRGH